MSVCNEFSRLARGNLVTRPRQLNVDVELYASCVAPEGYDVVGQVDGIFGPVMSIMRWDDEEAMLADANSVDYGLTASIWTNDVSRAYRLASAVDAGYVWINKVGPRPYGAPFGGFKFSGLGKESNLEELISFTREKVIDHSF